MNRKHFFLTILVSLLCLQAAAQDIYLIPTLHRLHQSNTAYDYDSVRSLIRRIDPDILAVEIRPEDIAEDTGYLKQHYPFEMWMARYWFPEKIIAGFDWLGSDIEGLKIPENYWQEVSAIKKLQKAFGNDSLYRHAADECAVFTNERLELLKTLSLPALLQSKDAALTNQYYDCLLATLKETPYAGIPLFFELRNQRILSNLEAICRRFPGKKIVVLTGDDHYAFLKDRIAHVSLP